MINYCYSIVKCHFSQNGDERSFNTVRSFAIIMFFGLTSLINILLFPFSLGRGGVLFSTFIAIIILAIHFVFPGYKCSEKIIKKTKDQINGLLLLLVVVVVLLTILSFYLTSLQDLDLALL